MISYKYGQFTDQQIAETKQSLRKKIFFLLIVAEDEVKFGKKKFPEINLEQASTTLSWHISGLNKLLGEPVEIVTLLSLLEEAKQIIYDETFNFDKYRKLILDAGAEVLKIASLEDGQSAKVALSN